MFAFLALYIIRRLYILRYSSAYINYLLYINAIIKLIIFIY